MEEKSSSDSIPLNSSSTWVIWVSLFDFWNILKNNSPPSVGGWINPYLLISNSVGEQHVKTMVNTCFHLYNTSWWFQPIWKIFVKLDHFPKFRGEHEKKMKFDHLENSSHLSWCFSFIVQKLNRISGSPGQSIRLHRPQGWGNHSLQGW